MNAFPTPPGKEPSYRFVNGVLEYDGSPGMSLRDYFAAKAMQGLMGRQWGDIPADELFNIWAKSAYGLADAMLKARES